MINEEEFKIEDKVICIQKPKKHEYQCKIGNILKVTSTKNYLKFKEINGNFRQELFELHDKPKIKPAKYNPSSSWDFRND